MRVLIWLALFVLVILALRKRIQTAVSPPREQQTAPPPAADSAARDAETMVCCAACQIYIPASEAVHRGPQTYCCEEHANQDGAR
ncbi:PP0621 family protein [Undibacterium sp.]|jgi:uncharacterized protein|uniref:PP0621 family protein n=1 Tax=Undibacterium sp. TaxID=1914977 RepID=UPI002C7F04AB|nr:PP0621 family protein [Undibacterium sp.]HTD05960.1 PP0621 family protein [Undibacterium sp.]